MVARSVQHGAAQVVVGLVVGIGARQFPAHFRCEAVVFRRPVDADQEQVAAPFGGDPAQFRTRVRLCPACRGDVVHRGAVLAALVRRVVGGAHRM